MIYCNRLPPDRGYFDLNRDMSVRSMPVTHGLTKTGSVYESAAYFLRNNVTERELLFFGDVEPDSISSKPQTINVWRVAAPKIPHNLASIFIECSWTSDRPDSLLFGHLNPLHLVDELVALALEVYKVKNNLHSATIIVAERGVGPDTRAKKRKKLNPISLDSLRGILNGVTVYIMHCKSDVGGKYDGPINQVIGAEVRALIEKKSLGVEVVVLEQGTRIREFYPSTLVANYPHMPRPCHRDLSHSAWNHGYICFCMPPPVRFRFPFFVFLNHLLSFDLLSLCRLALLIFCHLTPYLYTTPILPHLAPVLLMICSFMFFILTTVYQRCPDEWQSV